MAAPHIAGAAALWRAGHPRATPAQVRTAILGARQPWSLLGDPDGIDEGVLNVATF
jgi:subtilisin